MKWKMYYKMCNNEVDANGKKAKQALKDLLHIDNEKGAIKKEVVSSLKNSRH